MKLFAYTQQHPEALLAVTDSGEPLRYSDIPAIAEQHFQRLGHNLLFLLCKNDAGSLLAYLGALYSDMVPLLLDAGLQLPLLRALLEAYRPPYCLLPEERLGELHALLPENHSVLSSIHGSVLVDTGWEGPELHSKLKLLLTTSGSTGSPKLVRLSLENLEANAESIAAYLKLNEQERPITMLPMFYSYGMSVINSHIACGAAVLLTAHTVMERAFWERAVEATSFAGVPYTYEMLDRLRLTKMDLPRLKTLTQAGGRLPEALQQKLGKWCEETGRRFFVMYGQTEASPRISYLPCELVTQKPGSIGRAIPGGQLDIVNEVGNPIVEAFQSGRLIYHGKNVSLGYASCPADLCKGDDNLGILNTGDIAYADTDGMYYIVGREKRFLKLRGIRYSLDTLEQRLHQDFPGTAFACTGTDDALCLFLTEQDAPQLRGIKDRLIDVYGIPEHFIRLFPLSRLPLTATGKTDYSTLETLAAQSA